MSKRDDKANEAAEISILPDAPLPNMARRPEGDGYAEILVSVANQTTLASAHALVEEGLHPLALNFANGVEPGGGFLRGAAAQEETLCRSSALYATLVTDWSEQRRYLCSFYDVFSEE